MSVNDSTEKEPALKVVTLLTAEVVRVSGPALVEPRAFVAGARYATMFVHDRVSLGSWDLDQLAQLCKRTYKDLDAGYRVYVHGNDGWRHPLILNKQAELQLLEQGRYELPWVAF